MRSENGPNPLPGRHPLYKEGRTIRQDGMIASPEKTPWDESRNQRQRIPGLGLAVFPNIETCPFLVR
jgi:hypothetical protein